MTDENRLRYKLKAALLSNSKSSTRKKKVHLDLGSS